MDRTVYRRIVSAVAGSQQAIGPDVARSYGDHLIEARTGDAKPKVPLSEAVEQVRENEEVLQVELVTYSDETTDDVQSIPSWHIVLRRCVPAYEGIHAKPHCVGQQTHAIVSAKTGVLITKFTI
jgi:hypothetical protein